MAPDKFKGTFAAPAVAAAIARGLRAEGAEVDECPVADGGEGTLEVLITALGGTLRPAHTVDPLRRPMTAGWGLTSDGALAIVESAQACGLSLLGPEERDAERASSVGVGEMMLAAAHSGARRMLVAVGGTASTDGGADAVRVVEAGGGLADVELVALCDVRVPFEEAAPTFAPQKGADSRTVRRLGERLEKLAATWPRSPLGVPMTGAGGGLAGGLWACLGAELRSGADFVLEATHFDERLAGTRAVVIGEGRLDEESLHGKIALTIAKRAAARDVPVHAVVGSCTLSKGAVIDLGLASVTQAGTEAELEAAGRSLAGRGPADARLHRPSQDMDW